MTRPRVTEKKHLRHTGKKTCNTQVLSTHPYESDQEKNLNLKVPTEATPNSFSDDRSPGKHPDQEDNFKIIGKMGSDPTVSFCARIIEDEQPS
eukprot:CAMPEP_0117818284 /NCGR_PEP_ID=MMETSP0949-20121206/1156_1 /TAXON_ID=44440 /ORGANISM="Chattonella subsalsa, Strain CCMP2191" /LENGTH=92 /DNA_ID=CAMNT_0005656769 /DNA_START=243 /DNA_END=518 /DNA_ORIENTATION=+